MHCMFFDVAVLAKQEHQQPRAMHLIEVQVEMVALLQHDKAQVRSCVSSGGGVSHAIEFGKDRMLPRAVFGGVTNATAGDEFPHVVVALNVGTVAVSQAAGTAADTQASVSSLRPCSTFSIAGNDLFQGAWGEAVLRAMATI